MSSRSRSPARRVQAMSSLEDTASFNTAAVIGEVFVKAKELWDSKQTGLIHASQLTADVAAVYILKYSLETTPGAMVTGAMMDMYTYLASEMSERIITKAENWSTATTVFTLAGYALTFTQRLWPMIATLSGKGKAIAAFAAIALPVAYGGIGYAQDKAEFEQYRDVFRFLKSNGDLVMVLVSATQFGLKKLYDLVKTFRKTPFSWASSGIFCAFLYYSSLLFIIKLMETQSAGNMLPGRESVVVEEVGDALKTFTAKFVADYDALRQNMVAAAISGYMAVNGSVPVWAPIFGGQVTLAQSTGDDSKDPAISTVRGVAETKIRTAKLGTLTEAGIARVVEQLKREPANPTSENINGVVGSIKSKIGSVNVDASGSEYRGWVYISKDAFTGATGFELSDSTVAGLAMDPTWASKPLAHARDLFAPVDNGSGLKNDPAAAGNLARAIFGTADSTRDGPSQLAKWQWDVNLTPKTIGDLFLHTDGAPFARFVNDLVQGSVPEATNAWHRGMVELALSAIVAMMARSAFRPNDTSLDTVSGAIRRPGQLVRRPAIGFDQFSYYNRLLLDSWNELCREDRISGMLDLLKERYGKDMKGSVEHDLLLRARRVGELSDDDIKKIVTAAPLSDPFMRSLRFVVFNLIHPIRRGRWNVNVRALYDKCFFLAEVGTCKFCPVIRHTPPEESTPLFWVTGKSYEEADMKMALDPTKQRFSGVIWPSPDRVPGDPDYGAVFSFAKANIGTYDGMTQLCMKCYTKYWSERLSATSEKYGETEAVKLMRATVLDYNKYANMDQRGELDPEKLTRWTERIKELQQIPQLQWEKEMQDLNGMINI